MGEKRITVAELRELLNKFPADADITFARYEHDSYTGWKCKEASEFFQITERPLDTKVLIIMGTK